jgi:hypothetical protein
MGLRQMLPVQTNRRFRIEGMGSLIDSCRPAAAAARMPKNPVTRANQVPVCTGDLTRAGRFGEAAQSHHE